MTLDQAIAEVQKVLGYRTDKETEITSLFTFMQKEAEQRPVLPWFLRTDDTSLVTVAHQDFIDLPTGFLRADDTDALYVYFTGDLTDEPMWVPVEKDSPKYLRTAIQQLVPTTAEGRPQGYSELADKFRLFPTPDKVYPMRMIYYKEDAVPATGQENKWLKHLPYLLIGAVGTRVAASSHNDRALKVFMGFAAESDGKINSLNTSHEMSGSRPVAGGPD